MSSNLSSTFRHLSMALPLFGATAFFAPARAFALEPDEFEANTYIFAAETDDIPVDASFQIWDASPPMPHYVDIADMQQRNVPRISVKATGTPGVFKHTYQRVFGPMPENEPPFPGFQTGEKYKVWYHKTVNGNRIFIGSTEWTQ